MSTTFTYDEQTEAFVQRTRDKFGDSLTDSFMAELVIGYVFRRDTYNETGLHRHECNECGRVLDCKSRECVVSADFAGENYEVCLAH